MNINLHQYTLFSQYFHIHLCNILVVLFLENCLFKEQNLNTDNKDLVEITPTTRPILQE